MKKISVYLSGHRTSISIESEFFDVLKQLAHKRNIAVAEIIRNIDEQRLPESNLSSEIRIWILKQLLKTSK